MKEKQHTTVFGLIWTEHTTDLVHFERKDIFKYESNPYYLAGFYIKKVSVQ